MKNVSAEVKQYLNEKFDNDDVENLQLNKKSLNAKVCLIKFRDIAEVKQYIRKNCSKNSRVNTIFKDVHAYFPYDNNELNNLFTFNATINQMEKLFSLTNKYQDKFTNIMCTIAELLIILALVAPVVTAK